ncbi:hypothetical protein [Pelagibius marinus]|uniref:hypothetical protein n=1 Tax=Pelagibius marinus TaxID=2762760 RepID=UPI001872424F|nr:hypothetical protein [Pelagibius marinus]
MKWPLVLVALTGPAILVFLTRFLPTGPIKKFFSGSPDSIPQTARQEATRLEQELELGLISEVIGKSEANTPDRLIAKIHKAIQYAIDRHDWYEDQRYRVLQTHVSISIFILTSIGIALRLGTALSDLEKWILIGIACSTAIGLFIILFLFNKELDTDRPYRLISDVRFWFYRYVLGSEKINPKSMNNDELVHKIVGMRERFFKKLIENFDLKKSIREDLEQVFILQTLQLHKSASLNQLRWAFTYYLVVLLIQVVAFFAIGGLCE